MSPTLELYVTWTFPGLVDTQLSPLKMGAGVFNVSESQTEA